MHEYNSRGLYGRQTEFGADYQFGADAPTPENMAQAWQEKQASKRRMALLQPNAGSSAKIQRYTFGLSQTVTIATAVALSMSGNPTTNIRPQRLTTNAPVPGFARLTSIQVANVGVIVGGLSDAFEFSGLAQESAVDLPTLTPANAVQVQGNYDALLPAGGYLTATPFIFIVSFKGPASMTA